MTRHTDGFELSNDAEINNINYNNDGELVVMNGESNDVTTNVNHDGPPSVPVISPAHLGTSDGSKDGGGGDGNQIVMVQGHTDGLLSAIRGYRNGIITGVRIRIPYILQSVIYAILFPSRDHVSKVRFVLKQMFYHGRNLGLYVLIYKAICNICRNMGVSNGIDSWIGGFIGGAVAFGDSRGISGSVNNQIVLYLFARGVEGLIRLLQNKFSLPQEYDIKSPKGFRVFAGFSLALILWLTEYHPEVLSPSFNRTMHFLYYRSNQGPMRPPNRFLLAVLFITVSVTLGLVYPRLRLDNVLKVIDVFLTYENAEKFVQKCIALVRRK